ncbi:MAG TPA: 4-alpha-glucanotransferase [Polyangiaceae bacterium]
MTDFSERASGILLHPTSLPGPHGVGDLGADAHRFLEFLAHAGQRYWQMLPVAPLGGGSSPYDSPSAFAGNPLLLSLQTLHERGLLEPNELGDPSGFARAKSARYGAAARYRERRLRRAFGRFQERNHDDERRELAAFRERSRHWLDDYALFRALKKAHGARVWTDWPVELRTREPLALERARQSLAVEVQYQEFLQFEFDRQWSSLRSHAAELGVKLLGDIPMFVAHDGSDVWAHQAIFQLDERGERRVVAGVPPDYFSADGQRWGNPLYDWNVLRETGFAWWIARLQTTLGRFDALRLDHFIGFHRYWEIPAHSPSAREGRFVGVPGREFFERVRSALGGLPFIAEDLGLLTPEVHALRDHFSLPGMRVLEFAFVDQSRDYQPHRFPRRTVVYTGTHDNDTVVGWLSAHQREKDEQRAAQLHAERQRALDYAGSDGREPHWDLMRTALMSVADTAIFPLQDVLGQGTESRMNVPGTPDGNWVYRVAHDELRPEIAERMARLCQTYERTPAGVKQT